MLRRLALPWSIVSVLVVTSVALAPAASAAGTSNVTAFDCGYSAGSNTFKPVARVLRTAIGDQALDPNDRRMAVAMFLLDGETQIASLGTGLLGSGMNGTVQVPLDETRDFSPEAGSVFGDGAIGGGPLLLDHTYAVRVRVIDFTTDFTPDFFTGLQARSVGGIDNVQPEKLARQGDQE